MLHRIVTTWFFIQVAGTLVGPRSPLSWDTSNIIIGFSPYVSVLDVYDRYRYSIDDMVPLVSKAATRFDKLFVEIDVFENLRDPGAYLASFSIAKYNCLSVTKTKVQLFLTAYGGNSCNCSTFQEIVHYSTIFADEINQLCNDTVHAILLESLLDKCSSIVSNCGDKLNLTSRYTWGEVITVQNYCNETQFWNTLFHPALVVLDYSDQNDVFTIDLTLCEPYGNNRVKPTIFKRCGITDTSLDKIVNTKRAVQFWEKVIKDRDFNFFIYRAFDDYAWSNENDEITISGDGWWYLVNDPTTTNTSEFVFEEKVEVAERVDKEENPKYLSWYLKETFSKNSSGIIFTDLFPNKTKGQDFCRLLSLVKLNDLDYAVSYAKNLKATCGNSFQLYLLMNNLSQKSLVYFADFKDLITMLIPVDKNIVPKGYAQNYRIYTGELGFKYGYYINIDDCAWYYRLNRRSKYIILNDILADSESSIYVFHYEEFKDTVNLGARRMFNIRRVLFDKCRKLISKIRNTTIDIGFAAKAIHKSSNFFNSAWAMKNYVKYIEMMSNYAQNSSNTLVFLGQEEEGSYDGYHDRNWETIGWYSYNDFVEKKGYKPPKPKPTNSSSFSASETESTSLFGLSNEQLLIVICLVLAFLLLIILMLVLCIRLYRKKYLLTYKENKSFFDGQPKENGGSDTDPLNVRYDKAKYEVAEGSFKINTNQQLGAGEFGKVYHGTISNSDGEDIQVAVKTTNPQKLHKTMLRGLLSEIKVLAHLGQHTNIIRLLGANTSSLKTGKVYVFLELCPLGSLLSFLQNLSTNNSFTAPWAESDELESDIKYINLTNRKQNVLDRSLSDDFYRWSTEICNGMKYLAEKHVVHADLATRNVLLNLRREAKICDFGLSRRMSNYASYVKSQQEPLPWKWLAPEALRYMQFNEKTDVWAFGVTLWEIYSLGSTPYAGLSWDVNFAPMLESGLVLSKPDYEEKNIYKIMKDCWKILPDKRPSFSDIFNVLNSPNETMEDKVDAISISP